MALRLTLKNAQPMEFAERVNFKVQEIKRIARGYRNTTNVIIMIYFHLGGLSLKPTTFD